MAAILDLMKESDGRVIYTIDAVLARLRYGGVITSASQESAIYNALYHELVVVGTPLEHEDEEAE